ncbi:hypothetical protein [Rhodococcus globerulus]|uniref:hypothetical protein n=1 Tax=Rhodococcus globerulus TaxID=33008 RepID=UPI000A4A3365|nr:hypothetical protein [Rhodococcus globerulus]
MTSEDGDKGRIDGSATLPPSTQKLQQSGREHIHVSDRQPRHGQISDIAAS